MKEELLRPVTLPDGPGLAARLRPALIRFFKRKTGNAVDAEDLTQDVLVRALAHSHWKTPEEARGYIFRTAVNRLHDRRRRLRTQGVTIECSEALLEERFQIPGSQNPLERVLIAQEELSEIDRALEKLPVRTRMVLVLIKLEQLKPGEVADMLGISVRAVNKHVQKALAQLARICEWDERPR
jgi:RNA polymerase sigma factor (sigma-70 family)